MKKLIAILVSVLAISGTSICLANDIELTPKELVIKQIIAENYDYNAAGFKRAITNGNIKIVELFLKSGSDPNTTFLKLPMLFYAVTNNQPIIAEKLINAGANVNSEIGGRTILNEAIATKNIDLVNLLIKKGANVNSTVGESPLCYALKKNNSQAVTSLIKYGAIVDETSLKQALKTKDKSVRTLVLNTYKKQ